MTRDVSWAGRPGQSWQVRSECLRGRTQSHILSGNQPASATLGEPVHHPCPSRAAIKSSPFPLSNSNVQAGEMRRSALQILSLPRHPATHTYTPLAGLVHWDGVFMHISGLSFDDGPKRHLIKHPASAEVAIQRLLSQAFARLPATLVQPNTEYCALFPFSMHFFPRALISDFIHAK